MPVRNAVMNSRRWFAAVNNRFAPGVAIPI